MAVAVLGIDTEFSGCCAPTPQNEIPRNRELDRMEKVPFPGGHRASDGQFRCLASSMEDDAMNEWSNAKLCDVANLVLGAFLFFSPWIFGFAAGAPWTNAMMSGLVIAILSISALAAFAVWEEWLNLIVGLWVIVSPWVLGFAGTVAALNVHLVVGFLVAALAAIELWFMYQHPPRRPASR